jgi:hypothetical protein
MTLHRRGRGEELDEGVGAEGESLAGRLGSLQQEQPGLLSGAALGQLGDGAHTGERGFSSTISS